MIMVVMKPAFVILINGASSSLLLLLEEKERRCITNPNFLFSHINYRIELSLIISLKS
jgi:hypothetical protein